MNLVHNWLCNSAGWRKTIEQRLPWALDGIMLGSKVLEIGPGFGATTEVLRRLVGSLTCIEINPVLARRLAIAGVKVVCADATALGFPDSTFDAVVCFTMLHHIPSATLQDRLFAEAARVLRPGGVFVGTDSRYSFRFRLFHLFDTMVVVPPDTLPHRLEAAGLVDATVNLEATAFRFRARKPAAHAS